MGAAKRVFRHTAIQIAGRAVGTALGLVAIGIMTRSLGTEGFGRYTTVTAFLGIFAVLADFGISTTLVAMMSERGAEEDRLARNALGLRIALTAAVMAIAAAAVAFVPYPPEVRLGVAVMTLSFVAIAANQVQIAVFQRHVRMDRPALAEVAGRAALVAGVALAAVGGYGLFGMFAAVIAANVLQAALAATLLRGIAPIAPAFDPEAWRAILLRAWPIGVSIALNLIYLRADTLTLSLTRSQAEVGIYGAAYRVVDVLTVIPMLFMGIVLPFLSRAWSDGDRPRFARVLSRALDALALGAMPIAAGALVVGPDLMSLVAGSAFRESGSVLAVIGFGVAAIFIGAAFAHAVVAIGEQRRMIAPLAANATVSLALYLVLIPRYGIFAAAGVTVLSELIAAASAVFVTVRGSGVRPSLSVPLRAAVAATGMALALAPLSGLEVLLRVVVGMAVYAALAFATGAVTAATAREFLTFRREA